MLSAWRWFAGIVLAVGIIVHALAFVGPRALIEWEPLCFIMLAVFPPLLASIWYSDRIYKKLNPHDPNSISCCPVWMLILSAVLGFYYLMNMLAFLPQGQALPEGNEYALVSHGKVLRKISEPEYHQHRAYGVRTFSSAWIAFAFFALTMLTGAKEFCHRKSEAAGGKPDTPGVAVPTPFGVPQSPATVDR